MRSIENQTRFFVPQMYINVDKNGEFGNTMMMIAEIHKSKDHIDELLVDTRNSDIIFDVKENFDDTLMYFYEGKKNINILSMSKLLKGTIYVAMKAIPVSVWDADKKSQVEELKYIKSALISMIMGETFNPTDLVELSILLNRPYSKLDNGKAYFKKISSSFVIKESVKIK